MIGTILAWESWVEAHRNTRSSFQWLSTFSSGTLFHVSTNANFPIFSWNIFHFDWATCSQLCFTFRIYALWSREKWNGAADGNEPLGIQRLKSTAPETTSSAGSRISNDSRRSALENFLMLPLLLLLSFLPFIPLFARKIKQPRFHVLIKRRPDED